MNEVNSKILIVDDDARMRSLISRLLDSLEFEIVEAPDGEIALVQYREHHPQWVVMDIEMPVLDGLSATRAILQMDPQAQILIVTQHSYLPFQKAAYIAGARNFLAKDRIIELPSLLAQTNQTPFLFESISDRTEFQNEL